MNGAPRLQIVAAECDVLRIRFKTAEDAIDDYAWRRDPELVRFDGNPLLTASFAEFLEQSTRDLRVVRGDRRAFSLESLEGVHFGNIVYYNADLARTSAEVGITIALAEYRDRGLGTVAMVTFLRYLFATHAFRRVYLHTLAWNVRARASFERAGFEAVTTVQRDGVELVRMEVRRDWWLLWDREGRFEPVLARARRPLRPASG